MAIEETEGRRYRFGVFEVDLVAGELWRSGMRVKMHRQPFQVLCLLLERSGEVLTREEIAKELWPDGIFVDYEHGVNAAVNRLREALQDKASAPRYVETLPRRGYRFLGPVERESVGVVAVAATETEPEPVRAGSRWLANEEDLPKSSEKVVRTLFVLLQCMYLGFYVGTLANMAEIRDLMTAMPYDEALFLVTTVTAAVMIPVRLFLLCAALFHPPGIRRRYLGIWWALLVMDMVWALSPFLLLHHMEYGLAVACVAPLLYAPFAQRSLVLMGAMGVEAA